MWPFMRHLSRLLPITYALRGLRRALLKGSSFAIRKARQEGSLVQY